MKTKEIETPPPSSCNNFRGKEQTIKGEDQRKLSGIKRDYFGFLSRTKTDYMAGMKNEVPWLWAFASSPIAIRVQIAMKIVDKLNTSG